jgi:hypothetical protein
MYKESKKQVAYFCFVNTVIACVIIFLCGTLTASQKTAYNIYLREYSLLTVAASSSSVNMELDGKTVALNFPDEEKRERLRRYLKLTPIASFVYLGEAAERLFTDS